MGSQSLQGYKYPFNASEVPGGVSQYSESIDYANEIYARLKLQRKRAIRMLSSDGTTGGLVDFSVVPRDSFLWDFFIPAWSACGGKLRLGDLGDGGKWICGLWGLQNRPFSISRAELLQKYVGDEIMAAPMLEEGRHPCIVYAFGVRTDVSFEVELIQATGCHVWAFDPTVGGLPAKDKERLEQLGIADKLHFEKVGVGGRNEVIEGIGRVETLSTSMDRLGHANLDILKIDVEGYEWAVLQQLVKEAETRGKDAFLRRVGMIMLEIHFRGEYEDLTKA